MSKFKVAFIGTGKRARHYATHLSESGAVDLVALVDPVAEKRRALAEWWGVKGSCAEYDEWRPMMKDHPDLNGVVICSPNYAHTEPAVACLERGLALALEKPVAAAKADCERILDAERANNGRTLIGFVLRSSPFYVAIHRLLESGAIGQVVSIQADELPGWGVSSNMFRQWWRRHQASSGGSLLEKCCHDMDILNWVTGSRPRSLNSYGGRRIFVPNPALPERCEECGVGDRCKYYEKTAAGGPESNQGSLLLKLESGDRCIYNLEKDTVDVQSVSIEYENGAVVNFLMNFNAGGKRADRNFHAVGLKGRVWGNLREGKVYHYDNQSDKLEEIDARPGQSGHGGGDRPHALELLKMMENPTYCPEQDAAAGYLSAVMCFAADVSRAERRRVDLTYGEKGYIDIR